ncbi:MAG: ORF6N domain-containing protein [Daejeonella sp.]
MNKKLQYNAIIHTLIYSVRGVQVMLDRDLAKLYETETRTLKQAVNRNSDRFPPDFMLELTEEEINEMVSQSVIPSKSFFGGAKPYAFTEQGVAMLASVLKTPVAVDTSLRILRAFVEMRKLISSHSGLLQRMDRVEQKQAGHDQRFEQIFKALEAGPKPMQQGIFFDGQTFDAYTFAADLIRSAKKSIQLIDNYVDDSVLTLLTKRKRGVSATIYTKTISKILEQDVKKHDTQYEPVTIKIFDKAHDRFLIIDDNIVYHIGASLKDLGKKWFAFSIINKDAVAILERISKP